VAISADGHWWFLLNVSPDIRQQILAFPDLGPHPSMGMRGTRIAGCLLTDAELDHVAGLLLLREGSSFAIICPACVRLCLSQFIPIESLLSSYADPVWSELSLTSRQELALPDGGPSGLHVRAFELGRHVPRYVRKEFTGASGCVIGLEIEDVKTGGRCVYAPGVEAISEPLVAAAAKADCLLIDGTFWSDDEPIRCAIGDRTARHMGHVPVSGFDGTLAWLGQLPVRHRVYVHINNTNPMLDPRGTQYRSVTENGVRVAADGDEFTV
jgi:pyrroloquinoline quinone biosynthesis protein B